MRVRHPLTRRRVTIELTEPVRRGGVLYPAGHQFAVLSIGAGTVTAAAADGTRVVLPVAAVRKAADPDAPPPPGPTLAELKAAGLLRPAVDLPPPA